MCTCGGASVSFAAQIQPMFTASCAKGGCHFGGQPEAGLSLRAGASYLEIVNVPATTCTGGQVRVKPGSPSESYILNKLTGVGVCSGEVLHRGEPPLAQAQIDLIRQWICQGALNN